MKDLNKLQLRAIYMIRNFDKFSCFYGFVIICLVLIGSTGCYNEEENCDERPIWEDCRYDRPSEGDLIISVTINAQNPRIPISVYEDDFESGRLVFRDTLDVNEAAYILPLGYYSATAFYVVGADSILAVDGDDITAEQVEYCDEDCWEVSDADIDLRL